MKSNLRLALIASALSFVALPALADVAPPETEPCRGKSVGTACTLAGAAGTCQNKTCSKIDYASWNRDASAAPPFTTYDCVECATKTATSTDTNTATNTTTSTDTNTNTKTNTDGDLTKDDSGCSIAGPSAAKRVAPWLLAAAFSSLFLIGRRRRS